MADSPHDLFDPKRLSDQEQSRLNNLTGLVEAGVDPYPARVKRTHTIMKARASMPTGQRMKRPRVTTPNPTGYRSP